jgi:hypothetical protein
VRHIAICLLAAVAFAASAPIAAGREPSDNASCVAYFVVPQAQAGNFGETVRTFPEIFHPLGQTVSVQARSPRDACPFQPPPG